MNSEKTKELSRKRLENEMEVITRTELTIIVAPSGYGKTTVVNSFFHHNQDKEHLWLSLGQTDSDPVWVWQRLYQRMLNYKPEIAEQLRELGFPDTLQKEEYLAQIIVRNVSSPFYLILDDFQECNSDRINELITKIVYKGIPNIHFLIITRVFPEFPYEEMMLKGYCSVIDQRQLILTKEESSEVFRINGIELTREETEKMYEYTDGWIAAVSLSLLEYKRSGSLGYSNSISHLLKTTIFNKFSDIIQELLIKMSLFESFTLKEAVYVSGCGIHEVLFEEGVGQFGFIQYDTDSGRYSMHALLRVVVSAELDRSGIDKKALYQRSGEWQEKNGSYIKAIAAYQQAENLDSIFRILSSEIRVRIFEELPQIVKEIFEEAPVEMKVKYPIAYLSYIYSILLNGNAEKGEQMMQEMEEIYASVLELPQKERLQGEILLLKSLRPFHDLKETNRLMKEAYEIFKHGSSHIFNNALLTYGSPFITVLYHDRPGTLKETVALEKEYARCYMKLISRINGNWDELMDAEYEFITGNIDRAMELAEILGEKAKFRNQTCVIISSYYIQMRCLVYYGKEQEFKKRMRELQNIMDGIATSILVVDYELAYSYIYACIGQTERMAHWVQEFRLENCSRVVRSSRNGCIAYGAMLIQKKQWVLLEAVAEQMLQPYESVTHVVTIIYGFLYKALALYYMGAKEEAGEALQQSLKLAEADNILMPFVEHSPELSELFKNDMLKDGFRQKLEPYMIQYQKSIKAFGREKISLTPREEELMELVKEGYRNIEISTKLNIAPVTVEKNLTNIYRKLGVVNRVAAIAKLYEM